MEGHTAGELIRMARRRAGLSQKELAEASGISQSVVSAYERGRREPGVSSAQALLHAAGFDLALREWIDQDRAGRVLVDVLELADALPHRTPGELAYPSLRHLGDG